MKNELTYTRVGDYAYPNLTLQNPQPKSLGKYGRMRREYLKNHRPILYNRLILSEKLHSHLTEIDLTANRRLEQMMDELAKMNGVTEQMKAADQMKWVQMMSSIKHSAEEEVLKSLIYA